MTSCSQEAEWADYSVEFCGGTHLASSDEAGAFVLLAEEGLGRGVRRVLGVTHKKAPPLSYRDTLHFPSHSTYCTTPRE